MADVAVAFDGVSRHYTRDEKTITALEDVTFEVPTGSIYGVVGTSGAGKSTLIRTVNGLETPSSGQVTTLGQQPAELPAGELRGLRRQVGMIFQHYNLLNSRSVFDNVSLPLVLAGVPEAEAKERTDEALERVGLAGRERHRPQQLSGGQRQRVGIARALVTNPRILLCDEPTSALDPLTTAQILELLTQINEDLGITIMIITHQMDVVAKIADYVAVLDGGRLSENGRVDEVFYRPQAPLTRRFIETVVPQRLPESIATEIAGSDPGTLVRVVYTGSATRTLISDLEASGVEVNLYHTSTAPLRRTTVGAMVLGLKADQHAVGRALDVINAQDGLFAEVLR